MEASGGRWWRKKKSRGRGRRGGRGGGGASTNASLNAVDLNDIFIKYGGPRTMTTMRRERGEAGRWARKG